MINENIVSYLVYSEQYGLIRVLHNKEKLKELVSKIIWSKVEIWKNDHRQNTIMSSTYSIDQLMVYVDLY